MKLRSFFSVLVAVVVLLLTISVGGLYWLTAQSPLALLKGGASTQPAAAIFIPRQAPVMLSLLVNPDRLDTLRRFVARPEERRQAREELAQFKQSLLANTDLSYERDVQPWLGDELTWAVTSADFDRDIANGQQPGYLLAIATQDPDRSREFLQLFWQKRAIAGTDLVFEQYKGVKLIYGSNASQAPELKPGPKNFAAKRREALTKATAVPVTSLASAVVGDRFVLFANHPKVLRDAITNVQAPDLSLNSASFYQRSLDTLTQPRIGLSFVNLPRLASWQAGAAVRQTTDKEVTSKETSTPQQTLAITLELKPQGLLAETALLTLAGQPEALTPTLSEPVGALKYIPATTSVAASGENLDQLWKRLNQGLAGYETAGQVVSRAVADLEKQWQLSLPKDVFSWVTGEYALGLLPPQTPVNSKPPAEWIFVAEKSDPGTRKGLDQLNTIAQQQGLTLGTIKLGEQTVSAWTRLAPGKRDPQNLQAEVRGLHTSVGNYEVFATSIAAMEQALGAPKVSLTTAAEFQQAIAPLNLPNNGYLFVDWAAGQPILERQLPVLKVLELAAKPLVEHLRSLTLSSYGSPSGIQRSAVFLRLS